MALEKLNSKQGAVGPLIFVEMRFLIKMRCEQSFFKEPYVKSAQLQTYFSELCNLIFLERLQIIILFIKHLHLNQKSPSDQQKGYLISKIKELFVYRFQCFSHGFKNGPVAYLLTHCALHPVLWG
jgi:hypothetical protein